MTKKRFKVKQMDERRIAFSDSEIGYPIIYKAKNEKETLNLKSDLKQMALSLNSLNNEINELKQENNDLKYKITEIYNLYIEKENTKDD